MKGGHAGGLRHVTDDFKPALFMVKGKRQVMVTELSKVTSLHYTIIEINTV